MRIAIITGEYPPMQGGVGAYTEILARELATQGHEVFILTTPPAESGSTPGIAVSATMAGWGLGQLAALRRRINEIQPDVVNLQFQTAAFRMSPFVHFLPELVAPVPVVTTFHDLRFPYLFPKAGPLRTWIVHRLARRSARRHRH
ncbi:MAG: glycosyltransferase [Chloroflexi bacterium]|nr:glycosyltransferase [Chloroflexota bacterium]